MDPTYWMGHGFWFMWIFPVIFLLVFIFFMRGMFGAGRYQRGESNPPRQESAREILDRRFALGEINKDEYEEMKQALNAKT